MEARGRASQEEGREGPSQFSCSQTPSESDAASFAVLKASFVETDAKPRLNPGVLCVNVLPFNTLGAL